MIFHKKIQAEYKARLFHRCDDAGLLHYFSHEDFSGMQAEEFAFASSRGHELKGRFYSYPEKCGGDLVVFDHGLGGGHLSYMKEIERLCRAGYKVFAYDHTGCMRSGGESTHGLAQSLRDLDDCLRALKQAGVDLSNLRVMGHSWGGFSTMNISAIHPEVQKVVVLSGFVSVVKMAEQNFTGLLKLYRKDILRLEQGENPDYVRFDGANSLKQSNARALLVYSDDDPLVKKTVHYDYLQRELAGVERVRFILEHGKGHNPHYTADAVGCLAELSKGLVQAKTYTDERKKKDFRESFDWERMTAQDELLWQKILAFLA